MHEIGYPSHLFFSVIKKLFSKFLCLAFLPIYEVLIIKSTGCTFEIKIFKKKSEIILPLKYAFELIMDNNKIL